MDKTDYLLITAIIIIVIATALFVINVKSSGAECLVNPLEYGIDKMSKEVGSDLICTCSFSDRAYLPFIVSLNGTRPLMNGMN